jgi:hypothetical protein
MRYQSNQFAYDARTKVFTAESSELDQGGSQPVFEQVFDDACDIGLTMVSDRTGVEIRFYVSQWMMQEGDIVCWVLRPRKQDQIRHPSVAHCTIKIFND